MRREPPSFSFASRGEVISTASLCLYYFLLCALRSSALQGEDTAASERPYGPGTGTVGHCLAQAGSWAKAQPAHSHSASEPWPYGLWLWDPKRPMGSSIANYIQYSIIEAVALCGFTGFRGSAPRWGLSSGGA
jgi:hypothetical protein